MLPQRKESIYPVIRLTFFWREPGKFNTDILRGQDRDFADAENVLNRILELREKWNPRM
jgi:hypothetical protein